MRGKSRAVQAAVASSSTGDTITLATGAMSRTGSNGNRPRCGLSTSGLIDEKPSVWPSAGALATASMAMAPPAPALLSTMTGVPSCAASRSPIARAMTSLTPPAG